MRIKISDMGSIAVYVSRYGENRKGIIIRINRYFKLCKVLVLPLKRIYMGESCWETAGETVQWIQVKEIIPSGLAIKGTLRHSHTKGGVDET